MSNQEKIEPLATSPTAKRLGRWRWAGRPPIVALALLILASGGYAFVWKRNQRDARQKLEAVTARLDAEDPGWRFEAIVAEHNAKVPPPEANTTLRAIEIVDRFPKRFDRLQQTPDTLLGKTREGLLPNEMPNAEEWKELETHYKAHERGMAELRAWNAGTPRGRLKIEFTGGNPMMILLEGTQKLRSAAFMLQWDSMRFAYRGEADRALASAAAGMHLTRSVDFEPFLISVLIRIAMVGVSINSVEQALAWCTDATDPALAGMQELIGLERSTSSIRTAIRGGRAFTVHILELIDRGEIKWDDRNLDSGDLDIINSRHPMPNNIAFVHERFAEYLAMHELPPDQKANAIRQYKTPPKERENLLAQHFMPAMHKVMFAEIRHRAKCLCAEAGIACERYRLKHGRWPTSLDDLAAFGIPKVPVDPFDGQPLRYRVEDDGVTIYSVGENGIDDGGDIHRRGEMTGDTGFRLWNAAKRKIKAVIPEVIPDEPPPPNP